MGSPVVTARHRDVQGSSGDRSAVERSNECRLVDDRSTRGVDEPAVSTEWREFSGADKAAAAVGQTYVDGDDVTALEQLVLADKRRPNLGAGPGGEVLRPGKHPNVEGLCVTRHC